MTNNLIFFKANNYYNRKIKRFDTIEEYKTKYPSYWEDSSTARNIDYNDGINITIVVNKNSELRSLEFNYILAINNDNSIDSRWFITDEKYTRQGQWVLKLRRDLIADFWDKFMNSTTYIEKGWAAKTFQYNANWIANNAPLVLNNEDFSANKIKQKETEIKDKLGCKWLVGYLNKGAINADRTITTYSNSALAPDVSVTSLDSLQLSQYQSNFVRYALDLETVFDVSFTGLLNRNKWKYTVTQNSVDRNITNTTSGFITSNYSLNYNPIIKSLQDYNYSSMLDYANTKYSSSFSTSDVNKWLTVLSLKDKVILDTSTNIYYRCSVQIEESNTTTATVDPNADPIWYTNLKNLVISQDCIVSQDSINNFSVNINWSRGLKISFISIPQNQYEITISSSHNKTRKEAFDAFAIPVPDSISVYMSPDPNQSAYWPVYKEGALELAQELTDVDTEALDLQLLPYCPLPDSLIFDGTSIKNILNLDPEQENFQYSKIFKVRGNEKILSNVMFWLDSTQFSRIIPVDEDEILFVSSLEQAKAYNQLYTWRISSGDYSSSFEFNLMKNGGIQYFEIDCAYKPYQPYIHVAPNFGGLYGKDYNDTRGLICSNTNYSLPRLNDKWESYERNNLNYMNSFNRQIQNMDTVRDKQRIGEWASAVAGVGTGVASGAMMGSMIAPGLGTAIGAGVGSALSLGAGIADNIMNEQLYKENKQYAIDQFNMSLENVKALPNTLVAVGALNPNNKVFPVFETYSCTKIEEAAYKEKLKWNGMTINVIGKPQDYILEYKDCYFKGQVINIDIDESAHEAAEIATEVAKGIIIEGGT